MKAYMIKNKEGKYYDGYMWEEELCVYDYFYPKKEDAEYIISKHELKDCTIVPITICEGDLEEENRVLKKALELACEAYYDIDCCPYCLYGTGKENLGGEELIQEIVKHFIQQAKESEKDGN